MFQNSKQLITLEQECRNTIQYQLMGCGFVQRSAWGILTYVATNRRNPPLLLINKWRAAV
ncbi:hypothetical protein [Thiospirillum jenense]|uniref:Uncharacterized protein n=1 Tax=Thiospirillum jenense TaxID=1653858 RepID=A0A839HC14_9GAMM|nr:hypothetical protein [Thiospirillum jenense]MBB1126221.1 hypothetical protein [Thiospirillum jenense]